MIDEVPIIIGDLLCKYQDLSSGLLVNITRTDSIKNQEDSLNEMTGSPWMI